MYLFICPTPKNTSDQGRLCDLPGWKKNVLFEAMKNEMQNTPDGTLLIELVRMKMPFGKYKGTVLCHLPVSYLEWFAKEGFPPGKLGMLLATLYEIKINGLEYLLKPLQQKTP
jgi:uncharacterized protein